MFRSKRDMVTTEKAYKCTSQHTVYKQLKKINCYQIKQNY